MERGSSYLWALPMLTRKNKSWEVTCFIKKSPPRACFLFEDEQQDPQKVVSECTLQMLPLAGLMGHLYSDPLERKSHFLSCSLSCNLLFFSPASLLNVFSLPNSGKRKKVLFVTFKGAEYIFKLLYFRWSFRTVVALQYVWTRSAFKVLLKQHRVITHARRPCFLKRKAVLLLYRRNAYLSKSSPLLETQYSFVYTFIQNGPGKGQL